MEAGAIVALVLGSNAIIVIGSLLVVKKQIKHSREQWKMQQETQREQDKSERRREVKSEPLLKLRNELARMAGKGAKVGSMMVSFGKEAPEEFVRALADWGAYMESGEFEQVLFMQYNLELVLEAEAIRLDYEVARYRFGIYWNLSDEGKKDKKKEYYDEAIKRVRSNLGKVVVVQSKITKLLEGL